MSHQDLDSQPLPSKTQLKQEAHAQQQLGQKLTELSAKDLARIPVNDAILAAVAEFKRLPNSHGAKRRQLQYIGKLMRDCDYNEIATALADLENDSTRHQAAGMASTWFARILEDGDSAIETLLSENPEANRQQLRQLHRNLIRADESSRQQLENKLKRYLQNLDSSQ